VRNRVLPQAVTFSLVVAGLAFVAAPALGQGFRPITTPPSINYPAFSMQTVNLAASSPAIYTPRLGPYAPPSINYPAFTPLADGAPLVTSPFLTTGENSLPTMGQTIAIGQLAVYNPAAYQTLGTQFPPNQAGLNYPQVSVPVVTTQLDASLSTSFRETNTLTPLTSNGDTNRNRNGRNVETRPTRSDRRPTAYIDIRVPAHAELWFEGVKTRQMGRGRRFVSPPLAPGREFAYNVRATWTVNGKRITQKHRVVVRAGDWLRLDWTSPSRRAETTAASEQPR
jgi:uncharacterized protein (TIGR03000 family)